jgi:hypothetical protein
MNEGGIFNFFAISKSTPIKVKLISNVELNTGIWHGTTSYLLSLIDAIIINCEAKF